jgi:type IV secretion system protein VirB9
MRFITTVAAFLLIFSTSAFANDPQIREVAYSGDKVIRLTGHFGHQITIELPPDDRIESVALGDSAAWQATPNKRGNLLFLKPVDEGAPTNMTIVSARGFYAFELTSRRRTDATPASEITYLLRIVEPVTEPAVAQPAPLRESAPLRPINSRYSYTGSAANVPSRVFDDGTVTTFEWPRGIEAPAIFYRRADGSESIVNYSYKDGAIVVHQVAKRFILRNGRNVTEIFNDGFVEIERGPEAPQPRGGEKKKKGGFFSLFGE